MLFQRKTKHQAKKVSENKKIAVMLTAIFFYLKKTKKPALSRLLYFGVADGTRTHDNRNHNPGLYQLSYSHR